MTVRADMLIEVAEERERQEARYELANRRHDSTAWSTILLKHAGRVAEASLDSDPIMYRRALIRVAAIAVAAVEALDRVAGE